VRKWLKVKIKARNTSWYIIPNETSGFIGIVQWTKYETEISYCHLQVAGIITLKNKLYLTRDKVISLWMNC